VGECRNAVVGDKGGEGALPEVELVGV
jgi:hypothetical protein